MLLWLLGNYQTAILIISGCWLIFIYTWLAVKEIKISLPIPSPISFWALILIVRSGIASLYLFVLFVDSYPINFMGYNVLNHIHQGVKLTVLSDFLVFFSYFILETLLRKRYKKSVHFRLNKGSGVLFKHSFIFFLFTLLLRLLKIFGVNLIPLGSFFVHMANSGGVIFMMTLVIISINKPEKRHINLKWIYLVLLIETPFSLVGNSKEELIVLFIPLFIYFLRFSSYHSVNIRKKVFFVATALISIYLVLMIIFPMNQMKRTALGGEQDASISFAIESLEKLIPAVLPWTNSFSDIHKLPEEGIWYALSRSNMINETAYVYDYVDKIGTFKDSWYYFKIGFMMLTPRILWPEKPITNFGAHTTYLVGFSSSPEASKTFTALGFAGYMFFQGGFLFLIIFSLIHGAFYCISWHVTCHFISSCFMASFLYFYLIRESLRSFEGFADGGLTYYAQFFLIYVLFTYLLDRILLKTKPKMILYGT